jgi:hypothetical protein
MSNGLAVTAVERKGHADLLLVVAADFETVRGPTHIGTSDDNTTIVPAGIGG